MQSKTSWCHNCVYILSRKHASRSISACTMFSYFYKSGIKISFKTSDREKKEDSDDDDDRENDDDDQEVHLQITWVLVCLNYE